jgi:hypothetical protein
MYVVYEKVTGMICWLVWDQRHPRARELNPKARDKVERDT